MPEQNTESTRAVELIDVLRDTDQNGQFTTGYYVCGDDWTIREIDAVRRIPARLLGLSGRRGTEALHRRTQQRCTCRWASRNDVIKGNIAIIKHTDNGETQIETPEEGATFQIYLKFSGSFDAAIESAKEIPLICDELGFAQSKDLPYGVYTVHQVSGWEGRELMKDFDVFIAVRTAKPIRYLINNANFQILYQSHQGGRRRQDARFLIPEQASRSTVPMDLWSP